MVKEPQNVDFYTTGRQPSEQEFTRISEWIKLDKQKPNCPQSEAIADAKSLAQQNIAKNNA